jgi:argininosuccinate lyase
MSKLWKKKDSKSDPLIECYTAGTDYVFDLRLMPFDIIASRAHAQELARIKILSNKELASVLKTLASLETEWKSGKVIITPQDEDCHTVIENYLVSKLGETGKKINTGRSRNDQVLTALRLYIKSNLSEVRTQQAMLSTVGHYYANFVESLLDDADFLKATIEHGDKNPLGTAAGFGSSIPLQRERTTKDLGFAQVQINSIYAQNSRGKFESASLEALSQVTITLSRFSTDMLYFTSQEAEYFSAGDVIVTGSSIMPQKRNLDPLELVRGNTSVVIANQLMIKDIAKSLLSGYNRDLQLMKKPLMESMEIVKDSLDVVMIALQNLTPNEEKIAAKIHPGIFMADIANDMVTKEGIPFRDAYKKATMLDSKDIDLGKNIKSKVTLGAPGNLALDVYKKRLRSMK